MPHLRLRTLRDVAGRAIRRLTSRRPLRRATRDATTGSPLERPRSEPSRSEPSRSEPSRSEPTGPQSLRPEPQRSEPPRSLPDDGPEPSWPIATPLAEGGVNVVGYLDKQLSLGDSGRRIASLLAEGTVPTSPIAFGASPSPPVDPPFDTTGTIEYRNTIAVVAADQMPVLHDWHPEIFSASQRMIGYCFWELSRLSDAGARGVELLDEVWVATRFIQSVFERLGTAPVHRVPLPVAEPEPSARERDSFPPLADIGDRTVFGVTFDYFSVLERKNPLAAVDAFTRAFGDGEGAVLVVKTLNAETHPADHGRLVDRIGARGDIVIWDEHLSTADQFAFLSHLDVLVSLHRGEGLGVHLAEAMWLGVPCIATGYSGNLDFMDNTCSRLVGHELIDVEHGGTIYPAGTQWADPDTDDAADAMRALASDDALRTRIGRAARQRMDAQPTAADMVATARRLLDL